MSTRNHNVSEVVGAFADAWNRHDMDAFAELFAEDAEFVNVVGLWWKGRDAIRDAHAFTHSTIFRNSRLVFNGTEVRHPVPSIAIARTRWTLEGHVDPDGAPLPARTGLLVNVLAFDDGRWRIIDAQNTDIVEGAVSRPQ
jgi:uncharacterized protein (TIGR02246 family)